MSAARVSRSPAPLRDAAVALGVSVPDIGKVSLEFLRASAHEGFRFRRAGEEELDGTPTVRLSYDERQRPTVIQSSRGDVPARGRLWIDPRDGSVRRTLLRATLDTLATEIVVTYCPCEWSVLVPCTMSETIRRGSDA